MQAVRGTLCTTLCAVNKAVQACSRSRAAPPGGPGAGEYCTMSIERPCYAVGLRDPTDAAPGLFVGRAIMSSTSFAAAAVAWSGDGRVRAARNRDLRTSVVASLER